MMTVLNEIGTQISHVTLRWDVILTRDALCKKVINDGGHVLHTAIVNGDGYFPRSNSGRSKPVQTGLSPQILQFIHTTTVNNTLYLR